jgi:glycerol-3-phosphate acyltransferase PlsY
MLKSELRRIIGCHTPISSLRLSFFLPILIMASLIIWKHKDNIRRLRMGTEAKVTLKS